MAGDRTTPINDSDPYVGQPQANLWSGKTADLWSWGKPTGWGGPWWEAPVRAGEPSAPYLMTGFDQKCLLDPPRQPEGRRGNRAVPLHLSPDTRKKAAGRLILDARELGTALTCCPRAT